MGIFSVTFIVLLILKLTGVAKITWLVVFSPFLVWFGVVIFLLFLKGLLGALTAE